MKSSKSIDKFTSENIELGKRIADLKNDEENMQLIRKFVDEVVLQAEAEANRLLQHQEDQLQQQLQEQLQEQRKWRVQIQEPPEQQEKQQDGRPASEGKAKSPKASFSEFNSQVGNLARVYVVRMFDAICNCANNAAAAPIPRFKFRNNKKSTTTTTTTTDTNSNKHDTNINSSNAEDCNEEKITKTDSNRFKADLINTIKLTKKNTTNGKMKKSDKSNKPNKSVLKEAAVELNETN